MRVYRRAGKRAGRVLLGLLVAVAVFAVPAGTAVVTLGGTGADTVCGGGGFIVVQTGVGTGRSYVVPAGVWTLKTWSAAGGVGGDIALRVLRPTGVPDDFTVVGASKTKTVHPGLTNTFTASITVRGGDVLGLYVTTAECARQTNDPADEVKLVFGDVPVGGDAPAAQTVNGYQLNLSAVLDSGSTQIPHAGYCSAAGNSWPDGTPITPGTFLYLIYQQPETDVHYKGATPAIYVKGIGITCDPPPAGYTQQGYAGEELSVPDGLYPYYAPPAS